MDVVDCHPNKPWGEYFKKVDESEGNESGDVFLFMGFKKPHELLKYCFHLFLL
jgi:hypothetical protein